MYFVLIGHLNSDAKFSSKIFDLYLDFIKFTDDKVDSHTEVVPDTLRNSSVTELNEIFLN